MPNTDPQKYREYMRAYMKRRWATRKAVAIRFLGGRCAKCRVTTHLQFDHKDFRQKSFSISKFTSIREDLFWEEIKKCQLLCPKHHLEKSRPELSKMAFEREARKRVAKSTGD